MNRHFYSLKCLFTEPRRRGILRSSLAASCIFRVPRAGRTGLLWSEALKSTPHVVALDRYACSWLITSEIPIVELGRIRPYAAWRARATVFRSLLVEASRATRAWEPPKSPIMPPACRPISVFAGAFLMPPKDPKDCRPPAARSRLRHVGIAGVLSAAWLPLARSCDPPLGSKDELLGALRGPVPCGQDTPGSGPGAIRSAYAAGRPARAPDVAGPTRRGPGGARGA
jgi:hypothetical protein